MTELGKQPPVKELAHGRWPEILPLLGVDRSLLDGKHQACPFCGGKDRFRFTDHEGEGMYICNQCGPGSGFDLIMGINGCDFPAAALSVRRVLNGAGPAAPSTKLDSRDKARRNAEKIWRQSKEIDRDNQVVDYLKGRGLTRCATALRIHAGIYDGQTGKTWPSMVAPIHGPDQELLGLHITHLELDPDRGVWAKAKIDNPKKQRVIAGTVSGGSVQLFQMGPSLELGIAEGIETAIAVRELFAVACWSVMSTAGMEKFKLPDTGKPMTLRIFADNDKNHAGMKAAYNLANRLAIKDDYFNTFVERPPIIGDWLDFLNAHATRQKVRDIQ